MPSKKHIKRLDARSHLTTGMFSSAVSQKTAFSFMAEEKEEAKEEATHDGRSSLLRQIAGLYNNTKLSDVSISLGSISLPAHRFVLCLQSDYFSTALKESFAEGQAGQLKCGPGKEHAYVRMLQYLYNGDYNDGRSTLLDTEDDPELLKHPRVYFLADLLLLNDLKLLALQKFRQRMSTVSVSEELCDCVREIYANTGSSDDEMRITIVDVVGRHHAQLQDPVIQSLTFEGGSFTVELIAKLAQMRCETSSERHTVPSALFGQDHRTGSVQARFG